MWFDNLLYLFIKDIYIYILFLYIVFGLNFISDLLNTEWSKITDFQDQIQGNQFELEIEHNVK